MALHVNWLTGHLRQITIRSPIWRGGTRPLRPAADAEVVFDEGGAQVVTWRTDVP